MDSKFFRIPFAQSGDLATVPDGSQSDGSVSYTDGYGVDYSADPGSAIFQAAISGTTLTISFMYLGTVDVGTVLSAPGVTSGTTITALGSGAGGVGTYIVNNSQTVGSELMTTISDPVALLIERTKMNQLFNDLSLSLSRLQTFDAPQWITSADNGGTSFPYAAGARVLYTDGVVYKSLVAANTATPGTDPTKWIGYLSDLAPINSPTFTGTPLSTNPPTNDNSTKIATTNWVKSNTLFSKVYANNGLSFTFGTPLGPFTHGLGGVPRIVTVDLQCFTANAGFSPGDVINATWFGSDSGANSHGVVIKKSGTQVSVYIGSNPFYVCDVGGTQRVVTAADWAINIAAYV